MSSVNIFTKQIEEIASKIEHNSLNLIFDIHIDSYCFNVELLLYYSLVDMSII
jgi:hypothetical protein